MTVVWAIQPADQARLSASAGRFIEVVRERLAELTPTLPGTRKAAPAPASAKAPGPVAAAPAPPLQAFEQLTPQQALAINAAVPFSKLPVVAAQPFELPAANAADSARALTCLTMAVYYEAASESDEGQAAVAQVVLNRLRNPLFPKTVCGVVFQGSTLPTGCQFTFTCDGSLARRPTQAGWKRAQDIAARALAGHVEASVGDATHYHTQWVVPYWQPTLVKLTQIGAHIFYRWPGAVGLPEAFHAQYAGSEPAPPTIAGLVTEFQLAGGASRTAAPITVALAPTPSPPQVKPIQLVDLTVPQPNSQSALQPAVQLPDKPKSMFGHAPAGDVRLPVASNW